MFLNTHDLGCHAVENELNNGVGDVDGLEHRYNNNDARDQWAC